MNPTHDAVGDAPRRRSTWLAIDALGLAGALALTGGAYVVVARPMMQSSQVTSAAARQASLALNQASDARNNLDAARQRLAELEESLGKVNVQLRPSSYLNRQMDDLALLAENQKLRLTQLSPGKSERNAWYTAIPIRISGEGGFVSCVAFLDSVQDQYSDVALAGMKLAAQDETRGASSSENSAAGASRPATFEFEFVWYAAPEVSANADKQ